MTESEVRARVLVRDEHKQPAGLVHGGHHLFLVRVLDRLLEADLVDELGLPDVLPHLGKDRTTFAKPAIAKFGRPHPVGSEIPERLAHCAPGSDNLLFLVVGQCYRPNWPLRHRAGFAVRLHAGIAQVPGSVGQYYWGGLAGTTFWVDPAEQLFALMLIQGPGQREYYRVLFRDMVYAAFAD